MPRRPSPVIEAEDGAALETWASAQAEAALELGRLDARLTAIDPHLAQIFAFRVLRDTLHAVLSQEGHRFTEVRFAAWFAGLATLSDDPLQFAPRPRGLIEAVLGELAVTAWDPLSEAARHFERALLAPRDPDDIDARDGAAAAIREAGEIISAIGQPPSPAPLPFAAFAALHEAIGQSVRFALAERAADLLELGNLQLVVERDRPPSPRWALELSCGALLRACAQSAAALPMLGAIRLDATTTDDLRSRAIQADALALALRSLSARYAAAKIIHAEVADLSGKQRASSRAPYLYALLRSFGPLRSAQIEVLLEASRLGVRLMLSTLDSAGVLEARTIAGAKLYSARPLATAEVPVQATAIEPAGFSSAALAAYDASMAEIDALLARHSSHEQPEA